MTELCGSALLAAVSLFFIITVFVLPIALGMTKAIVYDVYMEKPDRIWLASDSGLYRVTGPTSRNWNARNGLPGNRVLWLLPGWQRFALVGF